MDIESITRDLSARFSHPRWILLSDVIVGATASIDQLRDWGGEEFLVIGSVMGVGDVPDAEVVMVPGPPLRVMQSFRRFVRMVDDPPGRVREAVDRFDPDGTARALGPMFACPNSFLGRPLYGTRPRSWEDLEDKTVADGIWEEAGIPFAAGSVVPVDEASSAWSAIGGPMGTVWAADNAEGWHGGGEYTRWVADDTAAREATEWFTGRAGTVRVMPFLDGVPCSIHGFVTDDGVGVGRPVELLMLRRTDRQGFVYGGVATVWDPTDEERGEMQDVPRRVGEVLRKRVGYRGPFGVDGVLTADGFRPTELNPRWSVGFGSQFLAIEDFPGVFAVRAALEGDLDVGAADITTAITTAADRQRRVHAGLSFPDLRDDDEMEVGDDLGGGTLAIGGSVTGSFVRWTPDPDKLPVGRRFAPFVAEVARLAAERWQLDLPAVEVPGID